MNSRSFPLSGRRRLRRVAIGGAAASALALGMLALPSGIPAVQASPAVPRALSSCQQLRIGFLCTWQNSNYGGTQWNFPEFGGHPDGYWWYVGDAANDKVSSLYAHTDSWAFVAKNCPADSEWTWIGAGGSAANLANNKWPNQTSMNDSISAYGIGGVGEPHPNFPDHGGRMDGGC
jgi:Peptidase inhibitor family I36